MKYQTKTTYICGICKEEFKNRSDMKVHYEKEHSEVEREKDLLKLRNKSNKLVEFISSKTLLTNKTMFLELALLIEYTIGNLENEFIDSELEKEEIKIYLTKDISQKAYYGADLIEEFERLENAIEDSDKLNLEFCGNSVLYPYEK